MQNLFQRLAATRRAFELNGYSVAFVAVRMNEAVKEVSADVDAGIVMQAIRDAEQQTTAE